MRQDRLSKTSLFLYFLGLLPVTWVALLFAPYLNGGMPEILKNLSAAMNAPFNIVWCEDSLKTVLIFIVAYALGICIWLSTARNYRRREEHGSARWGNTETICRRYQAADHAANKLLAQKPRAAQGAV